MENKILVLFVSMVSLTILSTGCDYYYDNPNFYINYVNVNESPIFVPATGGNIEIQTSVGNSDGFINCYYEIIASIDRYYSYDDEVLYSGEVYIGTHNKTINRNVDITQSITQGFYYVGVRIRNSVSERVKFTENVAFHKNEQGTTPANLTILNQSDFSAEVSFDGYEILRVASFDSRTINNVPSGMHTLKAELEKYNVYYTFGPENVNISSPSITWTINNTFSENIFIDNTSQYDAKIYVNDIFWGIVGRYDFEQIDNCLPGFYTLKATSTDGSWSWQNQYFTLQPGNPETWVLGNPPTGTITVINDSSEDVNVYIDNNYAGSIFAGNTLHITNVQYGSRKLLAEARYSNSTWGPKIIDFNGSYYWILDDQNLECNITFDSYSNETIDVYLDGHYVGTLYAYDVFTIRDVGEGSHRLYAVSYYGVWGPQWIYLDPGESYTWELWP